MGLVLFVQSLALELRVLCGSFRVQGFELGFGWRAEVIEFCLAMSVALACTHQIYQRNVPNRT